MNRLTQTELAVQQYYRATQSQYRNWGRYGDRHGLYAIHSGYHPDGVANSMTHEEAIMEMEHMIVGWMQIPDSLPTQIGDLGCGVGGMTALLATTYAASHVFGVTITDVQARIGQTYLKEQDLRNAQIAHASYMQLPCPNSSFDRLMFIESLMHAPSKLVVLKEAARTIVGGGLVHFQDPVLKRIPTSAEEHEKVKALWRGFCMPTFEEPLNVFLSQWTEAGLRITRIEEISLNVYPSAVLISSHAQMRLKEQPGVEGDEHERRVGGAVLAELMSGFETGSNLVGYYIVQATKD